MSQSIISFRLIIAKEVIYMKNFKKFGMFVILFSLLMMNCSYANLRNATSIPGHHNQSELLENGELIAKDTYYQYARGDYLAEGSVQITNNQDGTLSISAMTLAHRNVDRILHSIFLDVWDADEDDWIHLNYWDYEIAKEDVENEELHMLITTFTLSGYEVGRYYRVRGLHGVELYDELEACATETDGVKLTNWRD